MAGDMGNIEFTPSSRMSIPFYFLCTAKSTTNSNLPLLPESLFTETMLHYHDAQGVLIDLADEIENSEENQEYDDGDRLDHADSSSECSDGELDSMFGTRES